MGYTTDFSGSLKFNKPVVEWLVKYIDNLNTTRRMKRDPEKIKEIFPNWGQMCFNGELGVEGEFFVGGLGCYGQDKDASVIDHNNPAQTQPGLWCQWIINEEGDLVWDQGEKFYNYVEWLEYLIENIFEPLGYVLNGRIEFQGEDPDDFGTIDVEENVVDVQYGVRITSMNRMRTEDMIEELERRGYVVDKPA